MLKAQANKTGINFMIFILTVVENAIHGFLGFQVNRPTTKNNGGR